MAALFHTDVKVTYEEYGKMCWTLRRKRFLLGSLLVSGISTLIGIYFFASGSMETGIFFLVLAGLYPLLLWAVLSHSMHKNYFSQKVPGDRTSHFEFYPDYMAFKTEVSQSEIRYDALYRIIETKANLYLLLSVSQCLILKKEGCPEGLLTLLRQVKMKLA